ncbi:hypothetical protein MBLNU457_4738t2 [Dothideomycetes sp. NU457]
MRQIHGWTASNLYRRDSQDHPRSFVAVTVAIICVFVGLFGGLIIWRICVLKRMKRKSGINNRKSKSSWRSSVATFTSAFHRQPPVREDVRNSAYMPAGNGFDTESGSGLDRNTSVRSVITLPAYSATPRENDTVIAREGERAGMDTVVENPETAEEEEARREQEMDSLYQIRQQRRREANQRAARRRLRREARARGDFGTIAALRVESQRAAQRRETEGSASMIAEHEILPRGRKVSAVQYGDLGVASHDGSRVRASSNDSGRPLLHTAGSFSMSGPFRPWMSREDIGGRHRRNASSTNLSVWTYDSDDQSLASDAESEYDMVDLQSTRTRTRSRADSARRSLGSSRALSGTRSRATSFGRSLDIQADLGDSRIPGPEPPRYDAVDFEEAPPYEGPAYSEPQAQEERVPRSETRLTSTQAPQLPAIARLPTIRINPN